MFEFIKRIFKKPVEPEMSEPVERPAKKAPVPHMARQDVEQPAPSIGIDLRGFKRCPNEQES